MSWQLEWVGGWAMHKKTRVVAKVAQVYGVDGFAPYINGSGQAVEEPVFELDDGNFLLAKDEKDWAKLEDEEAKFYEKFREQLNAFVVGGMVVARQSVGSVQTASLLMAAGLEHSARTLRAAAARAPSKAPPAQEQAEG